MKKKKVIKNRVINKDQKKKELFKSNLIRLIVSRFELNDLTNPSFYIIGFKLICDLNQRDCMVETTIPYQNCVDKTDNEICLMGYKRLIGEVEEKSKELLSKKYIIGSEFVPPVE